MLALAASLGCASASDALREPSSNEVAALPSKSVHDPDRLLTLVSLDEPEEASSVGAAVDLRFRNERAVQARTQVRVHIGTEHEARTVLVDGPLLPPNASVDFQVPIELPEQELTFSGNLRIEALAFYADTEHAQSNALFRYFHPSGGLWQSYDEATRDRLYEGGALSSELRTLRNAALAHTDAANVVVFAGPARGTALSDDPNFVPESSQGESHE